MQNLLDFWNALRDLLSFRLFSIGDQVFSIFDLFVVFLILLGAKLLVRFLTKVVLNRILKRNDIDEGRRYASSQLVSYFIYFFATLIAFDTIGFDITIFLAGSAALLVGIGFGLQQTFNDLISGLILLFEGSVKVGDVVQVDEMIGRVTAIGMRTSHVVTRDKVMIVVPNSKITCNNVINWSFTGALSRFTLKVGVAYGSDVGLVKALLLGAAEGHEKVIDSPPSVYMGNQVENVELIALRVL